MSTRTGYFRLGLFVILASLLLGASVVYLGGGEYFVDRVQVETYFKEPVQGLDVGAPVKFRGVPVGVVQQITFVAAEYGAPASASYDERMYVRVLFGIDLKAFPGMSREEITKQLEQAVGQGLRMRLAAAGLTGTAFLSAELLDPQDFPALEVPWTPNHLYVPSAPSSFGAMLAAWEKFSRELGQVNVVQLGANVDTFLDNANKLLGNPALEKTIADASATVAGLREVVDHSKDDAQLAIKSLRSTAGQLDDLLKDKRVDTILTQAANTADQLPPTVARLRGAIATIDDILREQQQNIRVLLENLRFVSDGLTRLTGEAQDYPARMIFGDAPPHIKLKKGP